MVFWHVLWPCAHSLQRTHSGNMPGACFPVSFVADGGKIHVLVVRIRKKCCSGQLVLIKYEKKQKTKKFESDLKHLLLSLSLDQQWYFGRLFCESELNSEEGLLWRDVLFCGNHWRGSAMWPPFTYCLYPRFLLPPDWNNLKLFHCWIPLAMTQDSCHAVGYVNCMYNNPSRNTITVPILDPTSERVFSE